MTRLSTLLCPWTQPLSTLFLSLSCPVSFPFFSRSSTVFILDLILISITHITLIKKQISQGHGHSSDNSFGN
ncbi:MAG: hypothetical protein BYD32DRAFT_417477 [Podila humilis]|nr:MAG: hypothetical protein BYD32DRAFT_417477 [Podila humilis]